MQAKKFAEVKTSKPVRFSEIGTTGQELTVADIRQRRVFSLSKVRM